MHYRICSGAVVLVTLNADSGSQHGGLPTFCRIIFKTLLCLGEISLFISPRTSSSLVLFSALMHG